MVQTEIGDSESFVFIVVISTLLMNAMKSRGGKRPDALQPEKRFEVLEV